SRRESTNEPPSTSQLAHREHQLVVAFAERQVDGIVLRGDDAEGTRVAEGLRTSATVEDRAVQEDAHVVAITGQELLPLFAIGVDRRARVEDEHAGLWLETLRKIVLERHPDVRRHAISIEHDEARRLRLDVLPAHRVALGGQERSLEIARERVVGW